MRISVYVGLNVFAEYYMGISQEYDQCKTCRVTLTILECPDIGTLRIQGVCNSDASSIAIDIHIRCNQMYHTLPYNENRKLLVNFKIKKNIYTYTLYAEKILYIYILSA